MKRRTGRMSWALTNAVAGRLQTWTRKIGVVFGIAMAVCCPRQVRAGSPRLSEVAPPELASAYRAYRLSPTPLLLGPNVVVGMLLKVRINGGPALRLLLDSGAQDIVVDRKAARKSGHWTGAEVD